MNRTQYCERMKQLARQTREKYAVEGFKVGISKIRDIYKAEEIVYDLVPNKNCPFDFKKIQGAYMNSDGEASILINRHLPNDPRVFTMAHELKHHLVDTGEGEIVCFGEESSLIEISANIFAAEFVLPDEMFLEGMEAVQCSSPCTPDDIVRLKIASGTSLSYQGLVKKAVWLKVGEKKTLSKVKYHSLGKDVYGGYADARRIRLKEAFKDVCSEASPE